MTPAEIAAGLSEAQRRAVLNYGPTFGRGYWPLRHALSAKDLVTTVFGGDGLTPLGLAVRAILEKEAGDAQPRNQ